MLLPIAAALALLPAALNSLPQAVKAAEGNPHIVKVENGGLLFTDNDAGVSGTDAGFSLPMGDQTLWLFGDVFLLGQSAKRNYVGGVSNCALLVPAGKGVAPLRKYTFLMDDETHVARSVIRNKKGEGNETRLWPMGGWHDLLKKQAYLFYEIVKTGKGGGPFDFEIVGHGLTRTSLDKKQEIDFKRLPTPEGSDVWWPASGPLFGSAVVANLPVDAQYVYVVGVEEHKGAKVGKLARVRKETIEKVETYEYYAGNPAAPKWSKLIDAAANVEGLAEFPNELSVSYNAYLGGFLAVHSVGVKEQIRLSLAKFPWGPYKQIGEIGAPHRLFEKAFCYAGKEHPELAERNGQTIYLTYVDSQRYWLQLLKVTLGKQ